RQPKHPLPVARPERQHAIGPLVIVNSLERKPAMSKVLRRGTAMLAGMVASLALVTSALAQMPTSPWKKGAPFPEPDEELYGVPVGGKLYVFGGFGGGKAPGIAYEYNPATDRWTKKAAMPRPAHHPALAA